ncbi:MAG: MurT ligase domain-containing protein [Bacillota bacterium]|jgi:UDP-N-acetylmuramyl tripeptide synthase|nr:MurT ligase domain-containing protein [Bacillota bacterium]NLL26727.1 DUF1727 domain-containing protein [Erysipelotrichia bacterium]
MNKVKFLIAIFAGKISAFLLQKIFKRGTNTPGAIMLKICPDALARFTMPEKIICVTGTNGKTGTSNLLTHIIRNSGKTVVNNSKGSNMAPGLASTLVTDCTLGGKVLADMAVLEVDERSSQSIYTKFTPNYILCTNLFRDSIKRNGHSGFIFDKINDYLDKKTTLILNGNDGISGLLGEDVCERVFFSVNKTEKSTDKCTDTVCDLIACPKCNHLLDYDFYHYNHIGVPICKHCGFKMPESSFFASDVNFKEGTFIFNDKTGETLTLPFQKGNFFNVFNITGACAVCRLLGIDMKTIEESIVDLSSKIGRFQEDENSGVKVVSMLSKNQNPISCSQSLKYLDSTSEEKDVVLLITDSNDKFHGHEDISWLYDTDFGPLINDSIKTIYIGGSRCFDVATCLEIKGVDKDKFIVFENYDELASEVSRKSVTGRSIIVFFELYATRVVKKIRAAIKEKGDK